MDLYDDGFDASRRRTTCGLAAIATVVAGLVLAGLALWLLQPATKVVKPDPVIEYVRLPPEIRWREKIVEVIEYLPAPAPEVTTPPGPKPWEGIWKKPKKQLPMFQLKAVGNNVTGSYAPHYGGVFQVVSGKETENGVEVLVDDRTFRVKFRLKLLDSNSVEVQTFVTDESWLVSLGRANQQVRTLEQSALARAIMDQNVKLTNKPASMGIFQRGTED